MPGTVTIACKVPSGLHLRVFRHQEMPELIKGQDEPKLVRRPFEHARLTIHGTGRREADDPRVVGGYALTHGVDADLWAEWLAANTDTDLVKNNLIFAQDKPAMARDRAAEQTGIRSGLEPIDPGNLPPEFKRNISTATQSN